MVIGGDHQYKKRLDEAQDGLITLKWGHDTSLSCYQWMEKKIFRSKTPSLMSLLTANQAHAIYVCVCKYIMYTYNNSQQTQQLNLFDSPNKSHAHISSPNFSSQASSFSRRASTWNFGRSSLGSLVTVSSVSLSKCSSWPRSDRWNVITYGIWMGNFQ